MDSYEGLTTFGFAVRDVEGWLKAIARVMPEALEDFSYLP